MDKGRFLLTDYLRATGSTLAGFLLSVVVVLTFFGVISVFLIALGWPISHFGLGHPWAWGLTHLLYLLVAGMTLGMPVILLVAMAMWGPCHSWRGALREAREQRIEGERKCKK
ncbi:hypothetical protein JKG47_11800 [Acidithiobacillus sp. MC6.1]|nr:hypothetical protein [Acidithiobacillus sp. MC6.1]